MIQRLERLGRLRPTAVVASILGIGALALGQPLLDLLGRNPEFFIARRFPALDIGLLALGLLLAPALLALPVLVLRRVSPAGAAVVHLVVLALLTAVAVATVMVTIGADGWPGAVFLTVAGVVGAGVAFAYARVGPVRTGFSYLGLAPLVVGLWFAFATPTSDILFLSRSELPEALEAGRPVPVVMVVFDELPAASLMTGDGSLDASHLPNFARLAADGVWYRNAVSVRQQTEEAVPSILTGRAVAEGSIPITSDHPFTLFSLLADEYDIEAVENVTQLCPSFICGNVSRPIDPVGERWSSIAEDLGVVYGHVTLPDDLSDDLPPIDQGWGGFGAVMADQGDYDIIDRFLEEVAEDRRRELGRFVDTFDESGGVETGGQPMLRFAHFLYPHHPWDLTADGRVHGAPRPPGRETVGWGPDEFLVAQGWQRHLIQVQWTDTMLGGVLDALDRNGVYDEALVVVVADHGIAIRPGVEHQRVITPESVGSVAHVPLLVKYPADYGSAPAPGTVDDIRAETVDIVPTIAEVIDIPVPWQVDGISLLSTEERRARPVSVMLGSQGEVELPLDGEAVFEVAQEQAQWFPGGERYLLAPPGWESLPGSDFDGGSDDPGVTVTLDQAERVAGYVPGTEPIPAYLSGDVEGIDGADRVVAVVGDRRVLAVTRTYRLEDGGHEWEAMIDPALLDSGVTDLAVWLVEGTPDRPRFTR